MPVIIVFIRREEEPTLENNVADLWQDLPASLKNLDTFTFSSEKEFLRTSQSSKSNYAKDCLYVCLFFLGFDVYLLFFLL